MGAHDGSHDEPDAFDPSRSLKRLNASSAHTYASAPSTPATAPPTKKRENIVPLHERRIDPTSAEPDAQLSALSAIQSCRQSLTCAARRNPSRSTKKHAEKLAAC